MMPETTDLPEVVGPVPPANQSALGRTLLTPKMAPFL